MAARMIPSLGHLTPRAQGMFERKGEKMKWVFPPLAGLALLTLACGTPQPPYQPASPATPEQPRPGGVLRLPVNNDFYDFDPSYNGSGTPNPDATLLANDTLLGYKVGSDIAYGRMILEPRLAEKWEVSPDAKAFTFTLRKGLKFANLPPVNGRTLTSADVKWSYEYLSRQGEFKDSGLAKGSYTFALEGLAQIDTPDPQTVVVRFPQPYVPFLSYLGSYTIPILPREIYQEDAHFKERMAGSGPFQLDAGASQPTTKWVFKKNKDYWQPGKPYLDEIHYVVLRDEATRRAAFQAKQLDKVRVLDLGGRAQIKNAVPDAHELLDTGPQPISLYLSQKFPEMKDIRVRKAIQLAIDQGPFDQMTTGGAGGWSITGVSGDVFSQEEIRKLVKYDPERSKQLLKEAGYANGIKIPFGSTASASYGAVSAQEELVQAQLKKVGIDLVIEPLDKPTWRKKLYSGDFHMMLITEKRFIDPDSFFFGQYHSSSNGRWELVDDPKLDQLIAVERSEPDPAKRQEKIKDMSRHLTEQAYHFAVYRPLELYYTHSYVRNLYEHWSDEGLHAQDIWLAK